MDTAFGRYSVPANRREDNPSTLDYDLITPITET